MRQRRRRRLTPPPGLGGQPLAVPAPGYAVYRFESALSAVGAPVVGLRRWRRRRFASVAPFQGALRRAGQPPSVGPEGFAASGVGAAAVGLPAAVLAPAFIGAEFAGRAQVREAGFAAGVGAHPGDGSRRGRRRQGLVHAVSLPPAGPVWRCRPGAGVKVTANCRYGSGACTVMGWMGLSQPRARSVCSELSRLADGSVTVAISQFGPLLR